MEYREECDHFKSMNRVRGCDAPKSNTRVRTRTKTGDRIPGMLKIKGQLTVIPKAN